jgi:hypothetical protein
MRSSDRRKITTARLALAVPVRTAAGLAAFAAGPALAGPTLAGPALAASALTRAAPDRVPVSGTACGSRHKNGVTVVVDFTKFRRAVKIGCDATRPANGLVALRKAGFRYAFVPRFPGFICTINSEPSRCNSAPASAYWSYWHARPHGKWSYSTVGAGSYHPKSGWVEGWAFGNGKPPRISPP